MRASITAEKAGIPTVSIIQTSFLGQAKITAQTQGMTDLPIAEYPGVIITESKEGLRKKVEEVLIDKILRGLNTPIEKGAKPVEANEPEPRDIIFKGSLGEVNDFFTDKLWTDGLPIIPPTPDRVEEFLQFTDRSPEEVVGVLQLENREATIWNIAVNGVMAGCRPEYMPVLIAVVEVIADPDFRIQDLGCTPGFEPLIVLNGPIIKELDFNYGSGVMRVGRQANSSVGRFLRLYMRNIAGFRIPPGDADMGTIAASFNVVLAEDEDTVADIHWEPFSVDRGFKRGENVVTVQSIAFSSPPTFSKGESAVDHLETIGEVIGRRTFAYWTGQGVRHSAYYPLIVMSPSIASVMASEGWTKSKIKKYLYDNVKESAGVLEKLVRQISAAPFDFCSEVSKGVASPEYCESTDPDRMVPVFLRPDWTGIVVAGNPGRNQSRGYAQSDMKGPPVSKRIKLPTDWERLLKDSNSKRKTSSSG